MRLRFLGLMGLCLCGLVPHLVFAQETTSTEAINIAAPLILQMADGSFYHPTSGFMAPTREELLNKLGISHTTTSTATTSTAPITAAIDSSSTAPLMANQFPLKQAIERAQTLLGEQKKSQTPPLKVTLAIWQPDTDAIEFKEFPFQKKMNLLEQEKILLASWVPLDQGVVVALTYPLVKTVAVSKKRSKTSVEYVVYTPYAKALHTDSMVAWGKQVLDDYIKSAYEELRQSGVHSRAFPDRLMADVIDPALVKSIIMIEHLDNRSLTEKNALALEPFFVTLAANEERAYAYARSRVGAAGLAQFMPATYRLLARRSDVDLEKDFTEGTRNAPTAIKAQVVYLDAALAEFSPSLRVGEINEYLAAAYNAGTARVRRAIAAWGDDWSESRSNHLQSLKQQHRALDQSIASIKAKIKKAKNATVLKPLKQQIKSVQKEHDRVATQEVRDKKASLPSETVFYVKKYRQVEPLIKETQAVIMETSQKQ